MLTEPSARLTEQPRSRLFWIVFGLVITAQVVALWLVCSHQVRLAEVRDSEHLMRRLALTSCMQVPGATLARCTNRMPHPDPEAEPSSNGLAAASVTSRWMPAPAPPGGGSLPVSFSR